MTTDFEAYLLGLYDNKIQAQSHPTEFAQIFILWEKIDGGYKSKHYYKRDGADKPYRMRHHKLVEVSEEEVIVENYHTDWTRCEGCDMIFKWDGRQWNGKLRNPDQCFVRDGVSVTSEVHFTKEGVYCKDLGYDQSGNLVFGSPSLYKFKRGRIAQR